MRRKMEKSRKKSRASLSEVYLELPVSAAFALSILIVPSIYPQAPRLIQAIMGAVALIPTIKIYGGCCTGV